MAPVAPHLCVVGHPNKGKSSIVSTLTEDDSVQVGAESGTTTQASTFDFVLGGQRLLSLTDTPGFQRARQVLAWLQQETVAPAQRPARVRAFLDHRGHAQRFPDEVALLTPIMAGAGILYVVDGAQPVSPADEAEMEILRWTGQPRMAVINPMGRLTHQDEWRRALSQFFQWVRVFNPLTATLPAREMLLRAVGELAPGWSPPVTELCRRLEEREQERLSEASLRLTHYWCTQMGQRSSVSLVDKAFAKSSRREQTQEAAAEKKLRNMIDDQEMMFFDQLRSAWGYESAQLESRSPDQDPWQLEGAKLMNTETWYLWGLKQRELLIASGSAGAATGLLIDAGLGGTSLFLGALSGGLLGSASGWWASRQITGKRLGWLPLSHQKQFVGPVQHPNFPLVVMARALTYTQQLWLRPHAQRSLLALRNQAQDWTHKEQAQLIQWSKLVQKNQWKPSHQEALRVWVEQSLRTAIAHALRREEDATWQPNLAE
jgi:hypothetical protein